MIEKIYKFYLTQNLLKFDTDKYLSKVTYFSYPRTSDPLVKVNST